MVLKTFIAIDPPPAVKSRVGPLAERIGALGTRVVPKANMHITVLFLGGVKDAELPKIEAELAQIKMRSFECTFKELSTFGGAKPTVVYAQITSGSKELVKLNSLLRGALRDEGGAIRLEEPADDPADGEVASRVVVIGVSGLRVERHARLER